MFSFLALARTESSATVFRSFKTIAANMGVTKTIIKEGNGPTPQKGQTVFVEYTGWIKNDDGSKGKQFDTSLDRDEDLETKIGVGRVIRGWDEGVMSMKLGERAILDITSDYAYKEKSFPPDILPNSNLIFEVELKKIA